MKSNKYIARFVSTIDELNQLGKAVPAMILSHPGFGKTSTVEAFCKYKDYNLITIIPSQCAADDVLGLQCFDPKTSLLRRLTPSWFNKMVSVMENGKRTVLFIDEISTCDPYIQAPLLNLIFNRDLGERKLPENVFIVAAGNYSSDLDGAFKMTAPLVNRFLLLNLFAEDYDEEEILNMTMQQAIENGQEEEFFGLKYEKPVYSLEAFKAWQKAEKEIRFSKQAVCEETDDYGLVGFTSPRSFNFCLQFIDAYTQRYSDDLWMRVVGATLGRSNKRPDWMMEHIIRQNAEKFKQVMVQEDLRSLEEMCKEAMNGELTGGLKKAILGLINASQPADLSDRDVRAFDKLAKKYKDDVDLQYLLNQLVNKLVQVV